jgi:hypothetical protein
MPTAVQDFLDSTPMRAILGIPTEVLDQFMATAFQLYQGGRYPEAEVICRGLLAADHRYWYPYSLYASTLQKLGRFQEAVAQVDLGLKYEPGHPKLLALREAILGSRARLRARSAEASRARSAQAAPGASRPQEVR